jgi:hypothetical protein
MTWYSLYVPQMESRTVADLWRGLMAAHGYQPYDPFPGGTGTPPGLRNLVRLFVAPAQEGWVRLLGQPVESLLPELSRKIGRPVLYGWLTDETGGFALFQDGARRDDPPAFEPYLRPDQSPDLLERAFAGKVSVPVLEGAKPPVAVIGADALPPEIQQLAQEKGVDSRQANKLIERLSGSIFGKLDRGSVPEQDQARAVIMGGGRDIWNSLNGQRVRAIADRLALPANWRLPAWESVRDAYHVHRLRQQSPRMPLIPGDQEMMNALPDALDYLPVYMGQK